MAESAVKAAKKMLQKTAETGEDAYLALLEMRNTPRQGVGASPARLLLGRQTRALLPARPERLLPEWRTDETRRRLGREQLRQKASYDKRARDLSVLRCGDGVLFRPTGAADRPWRQGVVMNERSPRSYVVRDQWGVEWRRNRRDLLPTDAIPNPPAEPPVAPPAAVPERAPPSPAAEAAPLAPPSGAPLVPPSGADQGPPPVADRPSLARSPAVDGSPPTRSAAADRTPPAERDKTARPPVPPRRTTRVTRPPERLCYT